MRGHDIKLDKVDFLERMKYAVPMPRSYIERLITQSIDSNLCDGNDRGHRNLIIVMEELAELTKEISKWLRGKGDLDCVIEELADVQLGIWYTQQIVGVPDEEINKAMVVKMNRVASGIQKNGQYK